MSSHRPISALDVYAEANGLCCRSHFVYGKNPDGTRWCADCRIQFGLIRAASEVVVKREEGHETLMRRADTLEANADTISARVGPMPAMMVCEPCAAERKRTIGYDYVHGRIEEQAAKRRRVD